MDNIDDSELLILLEDHLKLEEVEFDCNEHVSQVEPTPVPPKKKKGKRTKIESKSMSEDDIVKAIALIDNCLLVIKYQSDKLLDIEYRLCLYRNEIFQVKIERPISPPNHYQFYKDRHNYGSFMNSFKAPYFKDSYRFRPRGNEDCQNGRIETSKTFIPWTEQDIELLQKSVRKLIVKTYITTLKPNEKDYSSKVDCIQTIAYFNNEPLKEFLTDEMERNIDWITISDLMKRKYTSNECKNMWYLFASPSINKQKWKKSEVSKLKKIARTYRYQCWDKIAEELGTSRTGYLCFLYYMKCIHERSKKPWNSIESNFLKEVVQSSTYGSKICWHKVVYYMENRSYTQIFQKWTYCLNPNIKKGYFEKKEDEILLTLQHRYNVKVSDMDKFLKNRTSKQINEKYQQSLHLNENIKCGGWTEEEDAQLLNLVDVLGEKWAHVASKMGSRSRTQVRHRYNRLTKKFAANPGINLSEIKRPKRLGNTKYLERTKKFINKLSKKGKPTNRRTELKSYIKSLSPSPKLSSKVDRELMDYFCNEITLDIFKKKPHSNATEENILSATHQILQMLKPDLKITQNGFDSLRVDESLSDAELALLSDPRFIDEINNTFTSTPSQSTVELLPPNLDTLYGLWEAFSSLRHKPKKDFEIPVQDESMNPHKIALLRWYQRLHTIFTWPCFLSLNNFRENANEDES